MSQEVQIESQSARSETNTRASKNYKCCKVHVKYCAAVVATVFAFHVLIQLVLLIQLIFRIAANEPFYISRRFFPLPLNIICLLTMVLGLVMKNKDYKELFLGATFLNTSFWTFVFVSVLTTNIADLLMEPSTVFHNCMKRGGTAQYCEQSFEERVAWLLENTAIFFLYASTSIVNILCYKYYEKRDEEMCKVERKSKVLKSKVNTRRSKYTCYKMKLKHCAAVALVATFFAAYVLMDLIPVFHEDVGKDFIDLFERYCHLPFNIICLLTLVLGFLLKSEGLLSLTIKNTLFWMFIFFFVVLDNYMDLFDINPKIVYAVTRWLKNAGIFCLYLSVFMCSYSLYIDASFESSTSSSVSNSSTSSSVSNSRTSSSVSNSRTSSSVSNSRTSSSVSNEHLQEVSEGQLYPLQLSLQLESIARHMPIVPDNDAIADIDSDAEPYRDNCSDRSSVYYECENLSMTVL